MSEETELIEHMAAVAHEQWSGWMRYLFGKCSHDSRGALIPPWAVERWTRQMETPYAELPEAEKESDRVEARRLLAAMPRANESYLRDMVDEARRERDEWKARMHEVYDLTSKSFDTPRISNDSAPIPGAL